MKERPIIFNAEMVRAILDGRKTQTRRPVRFKKLTTSKIFDSGFSGETGDFWVESRLCNYDSETVRCPFGKTGDKLWVRESVWIDRVRGEFAWYQNDIFDVDKKEYKLKPLIHMLKKHTRIWLEVTNIRVERVQDISEEDAKNEGCGRRMDGSRVGVFRDLWKSIYKNWNDNPFVWVIEFKVINNRV